MFLNVLLLLFSSMLPFSLSSSYQINFGFEHCFASDKSSKPASIMPDDVQIQTAQRNPSRFLVQNNSPVCFSIIILLAKFILSQGLFNIMKAIVWSCSLIKGMLGGLSGTQLLINMGPFVFCTAQYIGFKIRF